MHEDYDYDDVDLARRQRERNEAEYQAGIADGERRRAERALFGAELAEEFELQDELNRMDAGDDY